MRQDHWDGAADGAEGQDDWLDGEWDPDPSTRGEDDAAWRDALGEWAQDEAWRGDEHMADWPEWSAGPEYLMWKRVADDE